MIINMSMRYALTPSSAALRGTMPRKFTMEELERLAAAVDRRSSSDGGFRDKAVRKPAEAIRDMTGLKVSGKKCLRIIEHRPAFDLLFSWQEHAGDDELDELLDKVSESISRKGAEP